MNAAVAPAALAGAFLLLMGLERRFPLRQRKRPGGHRLTVNMIVSALALATGALITALFALDLAEWTQTASIGLLPLLSLPPAAAAVGGVLLLDLSFYYWHRANHVVPVLWRFHNVHHVDPDLDTSTAFRFHPAEVAISSAFRAVQIIVIGASPSVYLVYGAAFLLATMFHHSNLRFPVAVERALNALFVTPRMHGVHHSAVRNETNSNYGVILRWWDPLHRSLRLNVPQDRIDVGVPAYQEPRTNRLWNLLRLPFDRQRAYWRRDDGREMLDVPSPDGVGRGRMME